MNWYGNDEDEYNHVITFADHYLPSKWMVFSSVTFVGESGVCMKQKKIKQSKLSFENVK